MRFLFIPRGGLFPLEQVHGHKARRDGTEDCDVSLRPPPKTIEHIDSAAIPVQFDPLADRGKVARQVSPRMA